MLTSLLLFALFACGGGEPEGPSLEDQAAAKCPRVSMDGMAGDWIVATGDPKRRFRIVQEGDETLMWLVDPFFSNHKLELVGTRRDKDWRFEERPRGRRATLVASGGEALKRVYLQPRMSSCAMEVYAGTVDGEGREVMPTRATEFLQFPEGSGYSFTFRPPDEPLFVGEAAKSKATAEKQLAELGEPSPETPTGDVVGAAWTVADDDGDAGCTYDLDAYLDDLAVDGGQAVPATVEDGVRRWAQDYGTLPSGNHILELYRYRTCEGGPRTLLAVAALGAVVP